MTLRVHLEARKYVSKVHKASFRIVPIDYIPGKLLWGYALNWIKCVSETIYSLLPRHIPMSFSGRKKRKLERILIPQSCILKRSCLVIHTLRLIHKIHLLFILFRVWCSQTQCKIWFGYSILTTKSYVWCVILTFDVESWSALLKVS